MKWMLKRILAYVRQVVRIADVADQTMVIDFVKRDVDFRGAKVWILICAIFLASLGLNTNSVAVIIGAMLISPLMGPIIGIGVAVGTNDRYLLGRGALQLATAVFISIVTSAAYFLISPFDQAGSELLGRTEPTLLDVLIAVAGGGAGAVAMVRQDRSNVVPGVAIATALMPPLCTAGFGLSQLDPAFFFGAFYLFFINSVFIAASTFAVTRILGFEHVEQSDPLEAKKWRRVFLVVIVLTLIPSVYTGWNVLRRTAFETRASDLADKCEDRFPNTSFTVSHAHWHPDSSAIVLTLIGEPLSSKDMETIHALAMNIGLGSATLDLRQAGGLGGAALTEATAVMKRQLVGDLYELSVHELQRKDSIIQALRSREWNSTSNMELAKDLSREVEQIDGNVQTIAYSDRILTYGTDGSLDTLSVAFVSFQRKPTTADRDRLERWMRIRMKQDSLRLIVVQSP